MTKQSSTNVEGLVPRRVVIGANAHVELARALIAARSSLEIRGNRYTGTPLT